MNTTTSAVDSTTTMTTLPAVVLVVFVVFTVAFTVIGIWAQVRVIRRAGYSGWWVLIGFVPLVGLVMYLVFAFQEWPIMRELRELRAHAAQTGYGNPGFPPAGGAYSGYPPAGGYGGGYPQQ